MRTVVWLMIVSSLLVTGCSTAAKSNTARTAREQLLLSNAIDQSLAKVDFSALGGQKVFLEDKYLECVDKAYLLGSIRHRVSMNGGTLVGKADDADVVLEARSGGVGTDTSDSYLGVPEIVLPGMLTLPQVRFAERNSQTALAKIGLAAYDAKSGQLLGNGGVSTSLSDDRNTYVMGIGPWQTGTAREEIRDTVPPREGQSFQVVPASVAFQSSYEENDRNPRKVRLTGGHRGE